MQPSRRTLPGSALGTILAFLIPLVVHAVDAAKVRKAFLHPPREYATAPLWVWNDLLTEDQIRGTMRDLAGQRVKQVFVHPRPGLMTPYLGGDWFRLWKVALQEASKLDMNVWIYDENSYPSGFAGGFVPELMPESRGRGLNIKTAAKAPAWSDDLVGVFRIKGDSAEDVTARVKSGEALGEGAFVTAVQVRAGNSPWHGNRCYVSLLTPGVTEKFLDVTLGAYEREIGGQFGKRVPGVFTDEPNIRPVGGFPWCEDLPEQFQKRWGYSLLQNLASLAQPVGNWRKVRHDYYSTLSDLFIERWAKPYYERCDRLGLEFTGHYWDHEWPHCSGVPDNMAMAAWQHRPGIDTLMNQYAENTHAQFGNVRYCREISSLANQLGRKRTLVELYGAGGWDLRFEDMKRIGDWLEVLGINTLDEHLSYVTLRGARKRDHPQSFSYHEPWWEAYHVSASYLTRLSAALTQGEQINRVLVLEPTTAAWMYQGDEAKLREIGSGFFDLLMDLERAQIEYDLGCEDVIAREGRLEGRAFRVGRRVYDRVVIPPGTESLRASTWKLLETFLAVSQTNLLACEAPIRKDGALVAGGDAAAAWHHQLLLYRPDELVQVLQAVPGSNGFQIVREAGDAGILFHHRRQIDDGEILFLVNTSITNGSAGVVRSSARGIEVWDPHTGRAEPYGFTPTTEGVQAAFHLPPSGSLMLFLSTKAMKPAPADPALLAVRGAVLRTEVRRIGPNVLTLDYVDVTAGGETRTNLYFYQANQYAWRKNGVERNPWDSAVQFKDELIRKTFPEGSGFQVEYHFTIDGAVPPDLAIVIESAGLYRITCNGMPVSAPSGAWWLDKAFGKIPIAGAARNGENTVRLEAGPFTIRHELEPAYVLGDFSLKSRKRGWAIAPPQPVTIAVQRSKDAATGAVEPKGAWVGLGWNDQGMPFYSEGVSYREDFIVDQPKDRHVVALPNWYGSAARVTVNGKRAGYITAPPWQCDVTRQLKRGENRIEVVVFGTLKNTLGPHHGNHALGSAWPGMFQNGAKDGQPAGKDYRTVAYGLFEPFELQRMTTGGAR
jgi:hypothetical protein